MILRILFFLAVLLLLPLWGIDRLCLKGKVGRVGRVAFALSNVLLLLGLVAMAVNESYTMDAARLKGLLLTLVLCLSIPESIFALLLCAGEIFRKKKLLRRAFRIVSAVAATLVFSALVYGFTAGYRNVEVKHYTFHSPDIPAAFDGYRIVQLSDLHVGTLYGHPEVVARIVDSVNACRPDLVVFTGDLVNYRAEELQPFKSLLSRMAAKDGVFSIMGNHDYMQYHRWGSEEERQANISMLQADQRSMGWTLLLNQHKVIRLGRDSIAIVGVENDGRPPFPALGDLPKAQAGLGDSCFRILLSHDPTHWRRRVLPETDIPLTLSGHTHGMQFKLGTFSPASWFYPEWGGEYVSGRQTLYVSLGVGEVLLPFRLGAWPEITVITLSKE